MSETQAYINIFTWDEENVINKNPAVSYAIEHGQGHGGSNEDMKHDGY